MGYPALDWESKEILLVTGTITQTAADGLLVDLGEGPLPARRAASCLLAPEAGDTVLVSALPEGRRYVLAVLERACHAPATLPFPDGVRVESGAEVFITAADAIALSSATTHVTAADLQVDATKIECRTSLVAVLAHTVRTMGEQLETIWARCIARLGSSVRLVQEHDETQAASVRVLTETSHVIQAETIVHSAEKSVKIDGDPIHLA